MVEGTLENSVVVEDMARLLKELLLHLSIQGREISKLLKGPVLSDRSLMQAI